MQSDPYTLWTGRQIHENKRGSISEAEPAIMNRLGIDAEHWLYITQNFESEFKGIVGAAHEAKSKITNSGTASENEDEQQASPPVNYAFLKATFDQTNNIRAV